MGEALNDVKFWKVKCADDQIRSFEYYIKEQAEADAQKFENEGHPTEPTIADWHDPACPGGVHTVITYYWT